MTKQRFKNARICVEGASNPRRVAMALVEAIDEHRAEGGDDVTVQTDPAVVLILDQLNQLLDSHPSKFVKAYDAVYAEGETS